MNHNDFDDQGPDNPFASPQDVRIRTPTPSSGSSTRYSCDGTGYNALEQGWRLAVDNALPMLGLLILHQILRIPADNLDDIANFLGIRPPLWVFGVSFLYSIFIALPVSVGFDWIFVKAAREEPYDAGDMFVGFTRNYWAILGGVLLKWLVIMLGFALLIVPGIYLMIRLLFVEYLLVDKRMGPIEAFGESWRMTESRETTILFLGFMFVVISIIGFLACIVGLLWTTIFLSSAFAIYYHTICLSDRRADEETLPRSDSDNPFSM